MSKVYVYESCSPIVQITNKKTQVIQTNKLTNTNIPATFFKDNYGYCWIYIGEFESSYIPPQNVFSITYSGNFFGNTSVLFPSCDICQVTKITACTEVYFSSTRCDDNTDVVVKVCNVGPDNTQTKLLPTVGQVCGVLNPVGDDFCVTLNSVVGPTNTDYSIITPAWEDYTCNTCPLYKSYIVNSCNETTTGITVYDYVTSDTISNGMVVNVDGVCYTIISYEGVISDYRFSEINTPLIFQSFSTCDDCIINSYNTKK